MIKNMNNNNTEKTNTWTSKYYVPCISLGLALGAGISTLTNNNIGAGICTGLALGIISGIILSYSKKQ